MCRCIFECEYDFGHGIPFLKSRAFSAEPDVLAFEIKFEKFDLKTLLRRILSRPRQPVLIGWWNGGFVNDTARHQDKVTVICFGRVDDAEVAAVSVQAE